MSTSKIVRLVLHSRIEEIRRLGPWLEAVIPGPAHAEARAEIELALVELVSNIVRHGCDEHAGTAITVKLERSPELARIAIHHRGSPIPPWARELVKTALEYDPTDIDNLPVGHIGLAMAIAAMDRFAYEEGHDGNITRLEKALRPAA